MLEATSLVRTLSSLLHKIIFWCDKPGCRSQKFRDKFYKFPKSSRNSVQFISVQSLSRDRLCDPMNRSTPGLPVHHHLPGFTQTHAHQVGDAIQPSHPLLSPSPPAPNPSQHQSLC